MIPFETLMTTKISILLMNKKTTIKTIRTFTLFLKIKIWDVEAVIFGDHWENSKKSVKVV